jgi:hypothetical protein
LKSALLKTGETMDTQSLQVQALITFLTPFLIQLAKRSQAQALTWIDQRKPLISVVTSAAVALATSTGIAVVHAPHSLTITWPEGATLARGLVTLLVSAAMQFGGQHVFYEGFWRHLVPSKELEVRSKK